MTDAEWHDGENRILGMLIPRSATDEVNERGRPIFGQTVLLLFNAGWRSRLFVLPRQEASGLWEEVLNTAKPDVVAPRVVRKHAMNLVAHSVIMLSYDEHR